MRRSSLLTAVLGLVVLLGSRVYAEPLPFNSKVEVYRDDKGEVMAFALRLEQPFLAEEFEKSNYLRLSSLDDNAYLIYPRETKFLQKHAEFYGRLKGTGEAKLELAYEIVSENIDGSRHVEVLKAPIEVSIPGVEVGPESIYRQWAERQNEHFHKLLSYYPNETFFQYVLLQSRDRYGVEPPAFMARAPGDKDIETGLYYLFSGGLTMQESLQRQALNVGPRVSDLNIHISQLRSPNLKSPPYEQLLEKKKEEGVAPNVLELSRLVPVDQYMLHFNSMGAAVEFMDLTDQWGGSVLRLFTVDAREHHLREKFEDQLCIRRDSLSGLFDDGVVSELAMTGTDVFLAEGSDVTVLFRVKRPDAFRKAAAQWLADVKKRYPDLLEREFNYRGHKVSARYISDRMVSSFMLTSGEYVVYSNSHRAIRKTVDAIVGTSPNLHDTLDYRYLSTLLPPSEDPRSGYLFASDAFLRQLVSPAFKISEKRRLECFNNLVMLNNASLFYRLEYGSSPGSLSDLVEGNFVNSAKLVCPHGGAYAFDAEHDTCTCSLHNRIKYLTPNVELSVLKVSDRERQEYERYKGRYASFWMKAFDPLAARITLGRTVQAEFALLPFANSSLYRDLRAFFDEKPQPITTGPIARSAVLSLEMVPGREKIRVALREIPGVSEVLEMDPTLTDLSWIGDKISLHFCDNNTILEIDPTRLRTLNLFGEASVMQQSMIAAVVYATRLPLYFTIDVEDQEKGHRLLDQLSSRIFLNAGQLGGLPTRLDSYRLPGYKEHDVYVVSYQLYAIKVRLYVSLVGGRLVGATRLPTLREVIDAESAKGVEREAHLVFRLNQRALRQLEDELQIYWAEKSRQACHRNIMPIYNLVTLYGTPIEEVDGLSDSKYGVTCFCPDGGKYRYDAERDQVLCTVHGNRQEARQNVPKDGKTAFSRFTKSLAEMVASLRFGDDCLYATLELKRGREGEADE